MSAIFVTGFPGFLASALLPLMLVRLPDEVTVDCLVEPRFLPLAQKRATAIDTSGKRIRLHAGDISKSDLGLGRETSSISRDCIEVYHFAAIYDLGVDREPAMRINVEGTRNVLSFSQKANRLARFHHVSTCYVSGRYNGTFLESDLEVGQRFNNYYEETKYLSEVLVQKISSDRFATTIYRPSIVTGDSQSGSSQKLDGLYFFILWLLVQPRVAVMPWFRGSHRSCLNVVPSDYIVKSIAYLSQTDLSIGKVYQLADPDPLTVSAVIDQLGVATGRRILSIPASRTLASAMVRIASRISPVLDIPGGAVDYFTHPTRYDCRNTTADLAASGITCPPITSYLPRLVEHARSAVQADK